MSGQVIIGSSFVARQITVKKDDLIGSGDSYTFWADHWHEYPDGSLEIIDVANEVVASFRPHRWYHVFYEDAVANIEHKTDRR